MSNFIAKFLKPSGGMAKFLILLAIIAFALLSILGYLVPVQEFLNQESLTIQIGSYAITPYKFLKAIAALVLIFWLSAIISDFGEKQIQKLNHLRSSTKALLTKAFQILLYFIAFLIILDVLGIDLTALAVLSGAIGIGIGFGLQKITSNFISGLILLFEKSIEKDDLIELTDGTFGFVRHTSARYTLVETFDGKEILIPNEDFITNRVTNWTYSNSKGRVEIPVGISYKSDIHKAQELILEAAKEHPRCINDPEPVCYLREYGDSSVNFLLFFWVEDIVEGRYQPQSEVMFSIWDKFKAHNVEIPFPQRDVHLFDHTTTNKKK